MVRLTEVPASLSPIPGDLEVFTTAEVVLGDCGGARFVREFDSRTGFPELRVERRGQPGEDQAVSRPCRASISLL